MPNPEYQRLLRCYCRGTAVTGCPATDPRRRSDRALIADLDDETLLAAIGNLGGHDLHACGRPYAKSTTPGPPSSSPTPSRATACHPRPSAEPLVVADRRTVRRTRGAVWPEIRHGHGPGSPTDTPAAAVCARPPQSDCAAAQSACATASGAHRHWAAHHRASRPPRPRWAGRCWILRGRHPRSPSASSPSAPMSAPQPTWPAGSTRSASGLRRAAQLV